MQACGITVGGNNKRITLIQNAKLSQQIKVCEQTKEVMKENPNGWLEQ